MKKKTCLAIVGTIGVFAATFAAAADTRVVFTGEVDSCTPTCLSFDFLDVGSTVDGFIDFDAAQFGDGVWIGGDVTNLQFVFENPALPPVESDPPNPIIDNPYALDQTPDGGAIVVASGQDITNPRGTFPSAQSMGTHDGSVIDSGFIDLWLTEGALANNGAVLIIDFDTGTFELTIFEGLIFLAGGSITNTIQVDVPDPGPGVTQFNPATGHFYEVLEGTWDNVQTEAAEKGGHLVTINDADEQQWLVETFDMDLIQQKSNGVITTVSYWIGLNDRDVEGEYVWASGETLAETGYGDNPFPSPPWAPLEPSDNAGGAGTEDNVGLNFLICDFAPDSSACLDFPNSGDPGLWNDYAGNDFLDYGIVENDPPLFTMDVLGSFLRADSTDTSTDPVIVDLAAVSLVPGALLRIVQRGDFQPGENPNPNFVFEDDAKFLNGVFSASDILLDPSQLVRVPDAIDAGVDIFSDPTGIEGLPTDIPEDFDLEREATLVIPQGATHLFVGVRDVYLEDNSDPDGDLGFDLVRFPGVFANPNVMIGIYPQIGPGTRLGPDVIIGDNAVLGNRVRILRGASLGNSVAVGNMATIQFFAAVSDDASIGSNTTVERFVQILDGVTVGDGSFIGRRSVVCSGADVGSNVQIARNNLIDTNAVIPDGTQIPPQGVPPTPGDCSPP